MYASMESTHISKTVSGLLGDKIDKEQTGRKEYMAAVPHFTRTSQEHTQRQVECTNW
jgi:hypothetical protein